MTDFDYCEACRREEGGVVLYHVRVRGLDFTMCLRCRVRHGGELIR